MTVRTQWLQAALYTGSDDRRLVAALAGKQSTLSVVPTVRSGVLLSNGLDFVPTENDTPSMNVKCGAGYAIIAGYLFSSDAVAVLTVPAANPTNPRIDRLVLRVYDTELGDTVTANAGSAGAAGTSLTSSQSLPWGGSATKQTVQGQYEYIAGTPAASPVAPAVPARSLPIARINVAANDTSITSGDITDDRAFTAPHGGLIFAATTAARPANPTLGQLVWQDDIKALLAWDGSAWRYNDDRQGWSATISNTAVAGGSTTVNLAPPGSQTGYYSVAASSITILRSGLWGFVYRCRNVTNGEEHLAEVVSSGTVYAADLTQPVSGQGYAETTLSGIIKLTTSITDLRFRITNLNAASRTFAGRLELSYLGATV